MLVVRESSSLRSERPRDKGDAIFSRKAIGIFVKGNSYISPVLAVWSPSFHLLKINTKAFYKVQSSCKFLFYIFWTFLGQGRFRINVSSSGSKCWLLTISNLEWFLCVVYFVWSWYNYTFLLLVFYCSADIHSINSAYTILNGLE